MRPRIIELTIEGPVDDEQMDVLEESGVRYGATHTVLVAEVRDGAALFGVLQRLGSLGLDVLGLRTLDLADQPGVEIVVRGALGELMGRLLAAENTLLHASSRTYHLEDVQLAELLDRVESSHQAVSTHARATAARTDSAGKDPAGEEDTMDVDLEEMGPVDYLVVEFPQDGLDGTAFPLLVDLVERGIIRVLDLTFVRKDHDGLVSGVEIADLDVTGDFDLRIFEGASSSLVGQDDLEEVGVALSPGSAAGVLVYENAWAAPFATALRKGGGQLVAGGRIPIPAIVAALDAAEAV